MQQVERILNASGNIYYLENDYLNTELVIMSNELLFRKVKENYIYEDSKSKLVGEQFEEGDYIFLRVKEQRNRNRQKREESLLFSRIKGRNN